ncbi:nitrate- and nitrite sensing domain-containing protein [Streptomyces sp. NPDC020965]|uniref:sensor histidine kinase n=1 Tax=Streptomyces sp. NPDC020965 TaxID=3365105 RepID=UPI0037954756
MQGRFKRDGSAAAEQEPRGGTDRGSSPQHTQNQGPVPPGDGGDRGTRPIGAPPGPTADGPAVPPKGKGPTDTGSRIALRNWRISTRLVSLLTLPVVAATTLGGLRINESMERMQQLDHMQLLTDMTQEATKLAVALQEERDLTAGPLANNVPATNFKVTGPRQITDRARKTFLDTTRDIPNADDDDSLESIRANANQIATQVRTLSHIRAQAYTRGTGTSSLPNSLTVESYHRLIESLLSLSQDMAQATSNPEMIKRTRALAAFSSAKEYASMQRAIIAAALPGGGAGAKGPGLQEIDRQYGSAALKRSQDELKAFNAVYESAGGNAQELTDPLDNGNPTIGSADSFASRVLNDKEGLATQEKQNYLDWTDAYGVRIQAMKTIESTLLGQMEAKARELREESQREAIINGALILVVLGVSLIGAFVVARSMIRSLRRLQDTATKVAQDRLPELVKQLSESDPQDVDTSVESVGVHSRDEIGKVAAAFDDVHREAVRLAAEQALLRGNVNAMFTNLSRRSQGLIQRQLSLISELESREADPDQLSSLFKLDHLATRMRRNGENLLVLAGEEPGRRWTRPVPLVDVLRAAASEVEQYERIELAGIPATEVAGRVVNDLVHLLAELLENATSFSSPQTKVRVTGHALPDGRVLVEIHDTGIGLSPEDLAAINERLASPPTVDVSVSRRMGLFVVGRLSLRHGIRIQLRPSDSGGTTGLVMLPVDVAQGGKKAPGAPGMTNQGLPQAPAGGGRPGGGPAGVGGPQGGPGAGAPSGGLLGGAPPRGQVGAGTGQRAALPGRDGGAGHARQGAPAQPRQGTGLAGAFGNRPQQTPPPHQSTPTGNAQQGTGDRGRQLPPTGGPRPELPGGNPGWGGEQSSTPQGPRQHTDAPRGHEDGDAARGPGAADFAGQDFGGRPPQQRGPGGTPGGQFVRPDVFGRPSPPTNDPSAGSFAPRQPATGQDGPANGPYAGPGAPRPQTPAPGQDPAATGQFSRAELQDATGTGQFARPDLQDPAATGQFPRPDFSERGPAAPGQDPAATGQFRGPAFGERQDPAATGEFPRTDRQQPPGGQAPGPYPGDGRQDPAATAPFPRPDFSAPRPQGGMATGPYPGDGRQGQDPSGTGQFPRPEFDAPQNQGQQQNQLPAPGQDPNGPYPRTDRQDPAGQDGRAAGPYAGHGRQDPAGTGQFPRAELGAPQPPAPGQAPAPRGYEERPALPAQPQHEALPAAGPGDGRTPLFDTLETDWFRAQDRGRAEQSTAEAPSSEVSQTPSDHPLPPMPQRSPAGQQGGPGGNGNGWRASPNDELVRQAERIRKPAAGGITTSGLPRRVPRANLVAGTAQEQNAQNGPQVSRAPDDVRGRLTNLRRGIQQGRQQNNSTTGSHDLGPTHQQER